MNSNVVSLLPLRPANTTCAECGERTARRSFKDERFSYGSGEEQVELTVRVPVWKCDACGFQYTDGEAEEIRHAAICNHLGRLAPDEVRAIREQYHLSQQEWAARTGFGSASIKRWENGNLIQNESADRFLRLLVNRDVFGKLTLLTDQLNAPRKAPRFQTQLPTTALIEASCFVLRSR